MEWIIWVIVIVVIVAVVWWLLNRNFGQYRLGSPATGTATDQATSALPRRPAVTRRPRQRPRGGRRRPRLPLPASAAAATTGLAPATGRTTEPDAGPAASRSSGAAGLARWPPRRSLRTLEPDIESLGRRHAAPAAASRPRRIRLRGAGQAAASDDWESPTRLRDAPPRGDADDWDDDGTRRNRDTQWSEARRRRAAAARAGPRRIGGRGTAAPPVHHPEYTEPHAPTLPGAESAAAEAVLGCARPETTAADRRRHAATGTPPRSHAAETLPGRPGEPRRPARRRHGAEPCRRAAPAISQPTSPMARDRRQPAADGSGPEGFTVKGNACSMIYHDEDQPGYEETRAEVWFLSAAHAEAAGFRRTAPDAAVAAAAAEREDCREQVRAQHHGMTTGRAGRRAGAAASRAQYRPCPPAARPVAVPGSRRACRRRGSLLAPCTGDGGTAPRGTPARRPAPRARDSARPEASASAGRRRRQPAAPVVRTRSTALQLPWSTVFLPDGTAVISERDTALLKSVEGGRIRTIGKVPGRRARRRRRTDGPGPVPDFAADRLPLRLLHRGRRTTGSPAFGSTKPERKRV